MITVIVTKCVNKKQLCLRRRNELVSETWPLSTLSSHDPSNLRSSQSCYQQYLESRRYLAKNTFNFVVMMITVDTETIFTDVALITLRRMCEILDCSQVSFEDQIPHQHTRVVFFAYCTTVLSAVVLLDILLLIKLIMGFLTWKGAQ